MLWILPALGVLIFLHLYDYFVLRRVSGKGRWPAFLVTLVVALPWPWISPPYPFLRFCLACIVFNKLIKSAEMAWDRVWDKEMVTTFGRYLLWSANFPDTRWPRNDEDRATARKEAVIKLIRGHIKIAIGLGVFSLSTLYPQMHQYYYLTMFWVMVMAYFFFTGITDAAVGYNIPWGIHFEEVFDRPFLARSPREFWGKRWNLYFRDVAHRNIFLPIGGKKRPFLAVILVFGVSALMHEYLIFAAVGLKWIGWMSAFFAIHCFATLGDFVVSKKRKKKPRLPAPVGMVVHAGWILASLPLLMAPILSFIPIHTWRLW